MHIINIEMKRKGGMKMDIMTTYWLAILLVGFGTFFLIGEILVNLRGLGAILGISFIVYYFYVYLPDAATFSMMLIIYFIGVILILIDGKIVNDGTLATIGLAGMIFSVGLTAPNITSGIYAVLGILIGVGASLLLLKVFPKRNMWNKIALKDRLTKEAGYSSINESYEALIGQKGETITPLRPVGTIRIGQEEYSAISNAQWMDKGTTVIVMEVDGTRILVKKLDSDEG